MFKRLSIITAVVALFALPIVGCGGGSSGHASEWSDSDLADLESEIAAETLIERDDAECVVDKVKTEFPPSAVGHQISDSETERIEDITKGCIGGGSSGADSDSSGDEKLYGPACQEDFQSAACVEEGLGY